MTMRRSEKAEVLAGFMSRLGGWTVERSVSPQQIARYGRHLPPAVAAHSVLSYERGTSRRTREIWRDSRLTQRRRINGRAPGSHRGGERGFYFA